MGFADWWRGLWSGSPRMEAKASATFAVGGKSAPPRRDEIALAQAYATQPWLYAPVTRLAEEAAVATSWQLFTRPANHPDRTELFDDPILDLLRQPHNEIDPLSFWAYVHGWRKSSGNAFILVDTNALGQPVRLTPCAPHWVLETPTTASPFFRTSLLDAGGSQVRVPASNMIWLRGLNLTNPFGRGVGPAQTLADELDTDEYAAKNLKAWFYNGALPDVIISAEGAEPEELKAADEKFKARYGGPKKAHQVHWSGRKMEIQRLDTSFKEQDLVALRKDIRDRITHTYGIPPEIFGIIENSNRSTIDAAYYLLMKGVVMPMLQSLAGQLQIRLVPMFGRKDRYLGFRNPIPEDRDFQLRGVSVAPSAFTNGEFRSLLGFLPGDNADAPLAGAGITSGPTNLPPGN